MSQGTPKPSGNLENASNLRRALGIVYHHVIHDSMRQARVGAQNRVDMAVLVYSCITWWYMFPSARRKFEPESKLILTFWYFEDVISKWPKSLKYSIPLTKILRPQSTTDLMLTKMSKSNVIVIEADVS